MKYRITALKITNKKIRRPVFSVKRKRCTSLCRYTAIEQYRDQVERIRFDALFEMGMLPEPEKKKRKKHLRNKFRKTTVAFVHVSANEIRLAFRRLLTKKRENKKWLSFFSGALCGTLAVALICSATVLWLLFGSFFAPYDELTVPALTGESYQDAMAMIDTRFNVEVIYKPSDTAQAGTVLYQSPSAGAVRKFYKSKNACTVTLTVSSGKHHYTVDTLNGLAERDAILLLRNAGVAVKTVYEHSASVPSGSVISTTPAAGKQLYDGEMLVLKVSIGERIQEVSVPDLYGLTEPQAKATLEAKGLELGNITYKNSSEPAGRIITQQHSPYTKLVKGGAVDVTVSLGNGFSQKNVPDLYGLSLEQAEKKLAEYGLVIGGIYSVSSGAPKGTVVAQAPIAGTPITSTVISIDLFISS